MSIRADSNPRFFWRFALIGAVLLFWTGLCFKDALYSYPRDLEEALAKYVELRDSDSLHDWTDLAEENHWPTLPAPLANYSLLKEMGKLDKWPDLAYEHKWEETIPDPATGEEHVREEMEVKIQLQYVMAAVSTPLGLWALFIFFSSRGKWIEADETTIRSSWGEELALSTITELDKKKWSNKGIAKITYEEKGRMKNFVLDDCKYDRPATEEILRLVEANIQETQIVNGLPESVMQAMQEQSQSDDVEQEPADTADTSGS